MWICDDEKKVLLRAGDLQVSQMNSLKQLKH